MPDWRNDWSSWIQEGHFISYFRESTKIYEHVISKDFGHWEFDWPESITRLAGESGPFVPDNLEITRGYDNSTNTNQIWQILFGINYQVLIYIELPTDIHRHGIPKAPKPSTSMRRTSHFNEWMSPWHEPSFITEHFMIRPETQQVAISAYNPNRITITDLKLNFILNKMITERIGTEGVSDMGQYVITPSRPRFQEVLDKLTKRVIPCRPLTILGVRAPADAPSGQ